MRARTVVMLLAMSVGLSGCGAASATLAVTMLCISIAALFAGRGRQRLALDDAERMKAALASGKTRALEIRLRFEIDRARMRPARSDREDRHWLARAQLGGLLVAQWRLDEARELYAAAVHSSAPHVRALASFGEHEVALLCGTADQERLDRIRADRDACLDQVPTVFRRNVQKAWRALEGLALVRMGHPREGARLLEDGIASLEFNPSLVVYLFHLGQAYEHVGERSLSLERYRQAAEAYPGTRLASESLARTRALTGRGDDAPFRNMLPESPAPPREGEQEA